jgi:hypothetical protein
MPARPSSLPTDSLRSPGRHNTTSRSRGAAVDASMWCALLEGGLGQVVNVVTSERAGFAACCLPWADDGPGRGALTRIRSLCL